VTFEGELQVSMSGGIMEAFFVRSSMNETPLDHWIAGKEAFIFPSYQMKGRFLSQWSIGQMLGSNPTIEDCTWLLRDGDIWPWQHGGFLS
jgi:hypothetical protein